MENLQNIDNQRCSIVKFLCLSYLYPVKSQKSLRYNAGPVSTNSVTQRMLLPGNKTCFKYNKMHVYSAAHLSQNAGIMLIKCNVYS